MTNHKAAGSGRRGIREMLRKSIVSLKRSPQRIPLLTLVAAFLVFSLNLSAIANTTARINGANMGQCEFVGMLFSILAFVVFLRTFPRRKPAVKPMILLLYFMLTLIEAADALYITRILTAVNRTENRIVVDSQTVYISTAYNVIVVHMILIGATAVLFALLPVYSKAIRKIDTSIEVDGMGEMQAIDISGED